ncbi:hypothetical protein GGI25_002309 [Coemansia spiralis]|uniref:Uncharacterized protein n=2 Tax=Coemansia TaxID=4863 RepID=A0A9W8G424_9FUNG|nr:hypothetical protein BX070DRAFT_232452 [Coemansia spiralis]KAJ1995296.1 hypothetical protein EDC05_001134 [Coemansia umbellata]KAJ2625697.1 hypothetical protein GGI26_000497 [Coemansia sp. RSA 1358]KAJ2678515.1 hypothetical protein GGI25_002309 [Coemansia spiralis]
MSNYNNDNEYRRDEYRRDEYRRDEYPGQEDGFRGEVEAGVEATERGIGKFYHNDDGSVDKSNVFLTGVAGTVAAAYGYHKYKEHKEEEESERQDQYQHQQGQYPQDSQGQEPNAFKKFFTNDDGSVDKSHAFLAGAAAIGAAAIARHGYKEYQERQDERQEGYEQGIQEERRREHNEERKEGGW